MDPITSMSGHQRKSFSHDDDSETQRTTTSTSSRKVQFAEKEDIFIFQDPAAEEVDCSDNDENSNNTKESKEDSARGDSDEQQREASPLYHDIVKIRENMRDCVITWAQLPYWQLLEGSVDDENGEAKEVQKFITTFVCVEKDNDTPRGLERHLCRSHHDARRALSETATQVVLSTDFKLRFDERLSEEEISKRLRQVYKEQTRGAKSFARKMGKADEAAVRRGSISDPLSHALPMIDELKEKIRNGEHRSTPTPRRSRSDDPGCHLRHREDGDDHNATTTTSTTGGSGLTRRSKSSSALNSHTKDVNNNHTNKDKDKKEKSTLSPTKMMGRKTPYRFPSMSLKSKNKDKDKQHASSTPTIMVAPADDDLFLDVDKKGKTSRSSRWKDLKKRVSKAVSSSNVTIRTGDPATVATTSGGAGRSQ